MSKWKRLIKSPRIIFFALVFLAFVLAIHPAPFNDGVVIKAVAKNSSASDAGIVSPATTIQPLALEKIMSVDGKQITSMTDWTNTIENLKPNKTIQIVTDQKTYKVKVYPILQTINISGNITEKINGSQPLGISTADAPTNNLRKGLDLQGGIRVILEPGENVTEDTMQLMIESLRQRLNVYGLSDISVTEITDLSGGRYILTELAGATEQQARDLLGKQGKFEATIGNETVFKGGADITYVCRTSTCSGIDPNKGCSQIQGGGYGCSYYFSIALSPEAAKKHADVTRNIPVEGTPPNDYLTENLTLYLDNAPMRTLRISAELKGKETTQVMISGYAAGTTYQDAMSNSLDQMKQMQTILTTGSLPVTLTVARMDSVSPTLGQSFSANAITTGLLAILAVGVVCLVRYKRPAIVLPLMLTSISEVVIIVGVYALLHASLDLPAIAGIIVAVGTGVDHAIVITDEALRKEENVVGWKERFKRAFFIIFAAFATSGVALLWLWLMGSAMMKGFAITSLVGLVVGVFVTRPAYSKYVEIILGQDE